VADLIRVIGIGPGNPDYITPVALELISGADILIGGERVLRDFAGLAKETFVIRNNLSQMAEFIKEKRPDSEIAVLASGDPAFFGILEYLRKSFGAPELMVIPGISSVQLACARLAISWHDAAFYSIHGRSMEGLTDLVRNHTKVIVLTDPGNTPAKIARSLIEAGIRDRKIYVCENLSYEDEKIGEFDIDSVPEVVGTNGCVVVILGRG